MDARSCARAISDRPLRAEADRGGSQVTQLYISPKLNNFFGPLGTDIRKRLSQVYRNPRRYWDRDNGILLRADGEHLTLWQAILRVDPSFPRSGRVTDQEG